MAFRGRVGPVGAVVLVFAASFVVISLVWWSIGTGSRSGSSAAEVRDLQSSHEYSTAVTMPDGSEPLVVAIVPSDRLRPGSTFEVRYSGGSGIFDRGPGAGLISRSGVAVAGMTVSLGGNPPTWDGAGTEIIVPAIGLSGAGPDTFVVPSIEPGDYRFVVEVDRVTIEVPFRIR